MYFLLGQKRYLFLELSTGFEKKIKKKEKQKKGRRGRRRRRADTTI